MNCTPWHIKKRTVYRGFCLLVLIGLLNYACTLGPDHPLWDEELVSWARRRQTRRRRRAILAGRVAIVKMLLAKGADARAVDKDGDDALRIAQIQGYEEIAKILEQHLQGKPPRSRKMPHLVPK